MNAGHEKLGFVGLGHMGGNMASRYLSAGYSVYGEARSREGLEHLLDEGLSWCDTPREVAQSADIVITSIPNDDVLREIASGDDGIQAGLEEGKIWVDVSTVSPRVSRDVAQQVRATGAADARCAGVRQRSAGAVGDADDHGRGDKQAYDQVEAVLEVLGSPTYIGDNGQGLVLKLAINISLAVQMLALSEGLLLAERDGVDTKLALEVMTESPIGSPMLKARVPLILDSSGEAWFDVDLMHKDIRLALETADELHVPLPSAHAAEEVLTRADELGYGHRDIAALREVLTRSDGSN